jgi:kynurenine formamidase
MRLIDLSHTIDSGMAQYPGDDQPLRLVRRSAPGGEGPLSSALELGCHVGTHVDAPLHFRHGEPGLDLLPLDRFWGRTLVVDAPAGHRPGAISADLLRGVPLNELDFLIVRTGWELQWGTPRYYESWPYFTPELARALANAQLKGIGIDSPSIDAFAGHEAHDLCAAAGMINIENLANLAALPATPFTLLVLPLKLADCEASPVRAAALLGTL